MIRLGILGSTRGSTMLPIVQAIQNKKLLAEVAVVISNKANAGILENAARLNLPTQFLNPHKVMREEYDVMLVDILKRTKVDLLLLIGYMRILSKKFFDYWSQPVLNIHPSLLPKFKGLMDLEVHRAVLQAKETISGCTVHYVTEVVDEGPILLQSTCPVSKADTPETLKARIQALEGPAFIAAIRQCYDK